MAIAQSFEVFYNNLVLRNTVVDLILAILREVKAKRTNFIDETSIIT